MVDFVLDPEQGMRAQPHAARRAELRDDVLRQASDRARRHAVELVARPVRRASDLAMLWFQGDRVRVLRAVGGWYPGTGIELHIAHASRASGRYELAVYAVYRDDAPTRAA